MLFPQRGALPGDALLHSCPSVIVSATALSSMLAVNKTSSLLSPVNASNKLSNSFVPAPLSELTSSVVYSQAAYESQQSQCECTARTTGSCADSQSAPQAVKQRKNAKKEYGIFVNRSPSNFNTSTLLSDNKVASFKMGEIAPDTSGTAILTLRERELSYCIDAVFHDKMTDKHYNPNCTPDSSTLSQSQKTRPIREGLSTQETRLPVRVPTLCSQFSEKRSKSFVEREESSDVHVEIPKKDVIVESEGDEPNPCLQKREHEGAGEGSSLNEAVQAFHSHNPNPAVSGGISSQCRQLFLTRVPLVLPPYKRLSDPAVPPPVRASYDDSSNTASKLRALTRKKLSTSTGIPSEGLRVRDHGCNQQKPQAKLTKLCNDYASRSSKRCFHTSSQSSESNQNCCLPVSATFRKAARNVRSYAHLLFTPLICPKNAPKSAASIQRRCLVSQRRTVLDVKARRHLQMSKNPKELFSKSKVIKSVNLAVSSTSNSASQATQWVMECQSCLPEKRITTGKTDSQQFSTTCFPIMSIPNYLRKGQRQNLEQKGASVFLTEDDARSLTALCLVARWPYSKDDPNHESLLKEYWCTAISDAPYRAPPDNQWLQLGFQSGDPRTDFRGGGILSLMCMVYFAREHSEDFQRLLREALPSEETPQMRSYPLSACLINVATEDRPLKLWVSKEDYALIVLLRLKCDMVPSRKSEGSNGIRKLICPMPGQARVPCQWALLAPVASSTSGDCVLSPLGLSNFARLLRNPEAHAFEELFCSCCIYIHHLWKRSTSITVLDFNRLLRLTQERVTQRLETGPTTEVIGNLSGLNEEGMWYNINT